MSDPITFFCKPLGPCRVVRARGVEAMSALPAWKVDVLSSRADVDLEALLQQNAAIELTDDGKGPARVIPLLVTHASYAGPLRDEHRYALELSASVWPLGLRSGYRIFQKQTTQEIVATLLREAGVEAKHIAWRLAGRYAQRVQCVQYAEGEWSFLERLLADEGISYWFDATDSGEPLLVFGDSHGAHDGILGNILVPFQDPSGMSSTSTSFFSLTRAEELGHDAVHVRDYDVRHPDVLIEGRVGDGAFEVYEFPACVPHAEAASARAAVRLEQLQRLQVSAQGRSGCTRLQPGRVVGIEGASDDAFSGEWLIVEVHHEIEQSGRGSAGQPYRNRAVLVPRKLDGKDRCFRPAPPASRPRVEGLETAVVTGVPGEEVHVDDLGSVKLALPWDPSGVTDDTSSRWARTLQMNMGSSMLLPRVGWEVAVGYIDGNPDEPFVLGQLYNAVKAPPYPLPAMKATSALRSNTSPFDGSANEIRLGDTAGSQEMNIHASKTQGVSVGASASTTVGANEAHDIKQGYGVHVKGAQTISVGAAQHVDVGSDMQTSVKGARSETIAALEDIGVTANRHVGTGSYTELVGALYALQCNEALTTVKGAFTELVGGNLAAMAGLGTHESVAAVRLELVAGARNVVAAAGYEDETWGAKAISVGAARESPPATSRPRPRRGASASREARQSPLGARSRLRRQASP